MIFYFILSILKITIIFEKELNIGNIYINTNKIILFNIKNNS